MVPSFEPLSALFSGVSQRGWEVLEMKEDDFFEKLAEEGDGSQISLLKTDHFVI